jgi:hypothetical protein
MSDTSARATAPQRRKERQTDMMLYDHMDLRVSDLVKVRALYDAMLPAMGFRVSRRMAKTSIIISKPKTDRSPFSG